MDAALSGLSDAILSGKAVAIIAACVSFLMQLIKTPAFMPVWAKTPDWMKRWVPVILGVLSGVLSSLAGQGTIFDGLFGGLVAHGAYQSLGKGLAKPLADKMKK